MAANTSPIFGKTPVIGVASVSTANTNRDGTGTTVTVVSAAPAEGTRIDEIVLKATGDPADSIVTIFLHDGTNFWLYDEFDLGDPAAASTTATGFRVTKTYTNLVLPESWTLRAAITVALTSGVINVFVHGAKLTA